MLNPASTTTTAPCYSTTTQRTHDDTDSENGEVVIMQYDGLQSRSSLVNESPVERGVITAEPQPDWPITQRTDVDAARVSSAVRDRRVTAVMTAPIAVTSYNPFITQRH